MSWWDRQANVLIVSVLAAPLAFAFARWLAHRRHLRGMDPRWARRSAAAEVLIIAGTAPWLWLVLTPNPGDPRGYNLVPFRDLINQVHVGFGFAFTQITGNLLVFAALGAGLMIRYRLRPWHALLAGAVGSAIIESLQWVLDLGRFSSVDDVLVNAVGAYLAAWAAYPWWRRRAQPPADGRSGQRADAEPLPGPGIEAHSSATSPSRPDRG